MRTMIAGCAVLWASGQALAADPRIREVAYDPTAVVSVETKRGSVTHIELPADEAIRFIASGQGADCRQPDMTWCIDGAAGQRNIFLKPRAHATANTLSIVTDRRSYSFALTVLPESATKAATLRLIVRGPRELASAKPPPAGTTQAEQLATLQAILAARAQEEGARALLESRLQMAPEVVNAAYSIALGQHSEEIAPTAAYDDGRFTYLGFPGNRELPAVFQVAEDGSESMVNARMENDRLVVDRVAKRLALRKGDAVVAVINDEFDLIGRPPVNGTTAAGVMRVLALGDGAGRRDGGHAP
ncbi:MAG: TrbG/VirB9 family P-type conjugative transfer protein [Vitreoscilla sp.]|nr:TrbG/VirB9 family P-type conjugative transfer protein [Vitreoscilla sp.]